MANRSRKVSIATSQALDEIESMLQSKPPPKDVKKRKVSQATEHALNFIENFLDEGRGQNKIPPVRGLGTIGEESRRNLEPETPIHHHEEHPLLSQDIKKTRKVKLEKIDKKKLSTNRKKRKNAATLPMFVLSEQRNNVLTLILTLMFDELEHPAEVYDKLLLDTETLSNSLLQLPADQANLLRKILKYS